MDSPDKTEWPESSPPELANPKAIEKFLNDEISNKQVALVGELDLRESTSYAGLDWSLYDLANYLANKNIIKNSLTQEKMASWNYPATLAIWSVGKAQSAEDGNKLWDLPGYTPSQLANLATMFSRSIEIMELATFEGELLGAQRHVQLARIHAMIPDFAATRYSEIIHRAVKYNQSKLQIFHQVVGDTIISKGVQRLFSARQDIGLDLIERSFNYLAYGYELDLPDRLKSKLNREGIQKQSKKRLVSFPSVYFQEHLGGFEIRDGETWAIVDEAGNAINNNRIPETNIYAVKDSTEKILIFDKSEGYFIFDSKGALTYGSALPADGGFLIWHNKVKIKSDLDHLDFGYLPMWEEWNFTYFQDVSELVLEMPSGASKVFSARKFLSVKDFKVPNLLDKNGNPVYSAYPEISDVQYLKMTDHLNDTQIELNQHLGPVIDDLGGDINLTISSGLGKSRTWVGLVIPGIQVTGLENSQRIGANVHASLKLPPDWKFILPSTSEGQSKSSVNIEVRSDQEALLFKVCNSRNDEYFMGLEIPVLSWSVEFSAKESVTVATSLRVGISERKLVRALILHNVNEYIPVVMAGEIPVIGRRRGSDVRYDLRILSDMKIDNEHPVSMKWNYENLDLITFVRPQSTKLQAVDPKNFALDAIAKGLFTQGDWDSYQADTKKQSHDLRMALRRQRGN
jgi:hypothetical protein